MRFSASLSSFSPLPPSAATVILLGLLLLPSSLASSGHSRLTQGEKRRGTAEKRNVGFPFLRLGKRDDCGTMFGATWVDCGIKGCFQPSLGEVCCPSFGTYCLAGQYCLGNSCCPNGLGYNCCNTGRDCPANVSSYYSVSYSTPPTPATTSLPVAVTTSAKVSTTSSAKMSTSALAVVTTPLTTSLAPVTVQSSTSSVVAGAGTETGPTITGPGVVTTGPPIGTSSAHTNTAGGVSSSVAGSGAEEMRMRMGIEGFAVAFLGVVGFVVGLM